MLRNEMHFIKWSVRHWYLKPRNVYVIYSDNLPILKGTMISLIEEISIHVRIAIPKQIQNFQNRK